MSSSRAHTTVHPPPAPDFTSAPIEHPLRVTLSNPREQDIYSNTYPLWKPPPGRALFGGILIGQAIHAASATVPSEFVISSMNCSFLAGPDTSKPLFYCIERWGDGKSFRSRGVRAVQGERIFFTAVCSFSLPGKQSSRGTLHQVDMPPHAEKPESDTLDISQAVATNERFLTEKMILPEFLTFAGPATTRQQVDPFLWQEFEPQEDPSMRASTKILHAWARTRGDMSGDPTSHWAVLGCLTDSWFLGSFPEMNPAAAGPDGENIKFVVTLNHNIWFHEPSVRLDEWLFIEKGSSWAAEGRCLLEQRIWHASGQLVASCIQEGIVRLKTPESEEKSGDSKESKL